eukprot:6671014-Heterocapsa_arctica.AAC.1
MVTLQLIGRILKRRGLTHDSPSPDPSRPSAPRTHAEAHRRTSWRPSSRSPCRQHAGRQVACPRTRQTPACLQ